MHWPILTRHRDYDMRFLFCCLAALAPFAAAAQSTSPDAGQAQRTELELAFLLLSGKTGTQKSGEAGLKFQIPAAPAQGQPDTASAELSKISHCQYLLTWDLIQQISPDEKLLFKIRGTYDFSKNATATLAPAAKGAVRITFTGAKGIIEVTTDVYMTRNGWPVSTTKERETEDNWALELEPASGDADAAAYRVAAKDFASLFCPTFQPPDP